MKNLKTGVTLVAITALFISSASVHSEDKKTLKSETVEKQTIQIKSLNMRPRASYPITSRIRIGPVAISQPKNNNPGANLVLDKTGSLRSGGGGGKAYGIGIVYRF